MSYSLNMSKLLEGSYLGECCKAYIKVIKGDTRSLDYSSHAQGRMPLFQCVPWSLPRLGVSQHQGFRFGDPHKKDYTIFGLTLGSPLLRSRNLPPVMLRSCAFACG